MKKQGAHNGGFALILTLWVLAILSVLLLTFSMMVRGNIKAGSYFSKEVVASGLARGGAKRVALELLPREEIGKTAEVAAINGALLGGWFVDPATWNAVKIDDREFTTELDEYVLCQVTVEDGKLPLNRMTKEMFSKLPNVSPVLAEALVAGKKVGEAGSSIEPPAGTSGTKAGASGPAGAYRSVEELLKVQGVEGVAYDGDKDHPGLKHLLTTYTDGKISVNSAGKEVFRAIPGVDEQLAAEIEARIKAGKFFEKVEDLKHVLGVTPTIYKVLGQWLKVNPRFYRIKAKATVSGISRTVEAVFEVDKTGIQVLYMNGG